MYWNLPLPRVIKMRDGKSIRNLKEAANFISRQRDMNCWQTAAGKVIAASKPGTPEDFEIATQGIENALFVDGKRLALE